ncbi:small GTPase LIP1 [Senna tora]|uniref:Small GTPase LIP1 n=1 Tax=Senna tora TaxID=362788 RepID=A0A834X979_9FABA|nr:small GTPase LIP1 [Senna tora]
MFWRDRERENLDPNGGPPHAQVRVLVVGDSVLDKNGEILGTPYGASQSYVTTTNTRVKIYNPQRFIVFDKHLEDGGNCKAIVHRQLSSSHVTISLGILLVLCVGKTSLVHLIVKGFPIARPPQTIGCSVGVKHTIYGDSGSSSNSLKGDSERGFFIELWDVSGHDRYKDCRSLFYTQINGIIFVHDLSQRRTKSSLQKWAAEIAAIGTFSAPGVPGGPGGLPIPYIVVGNKVDIAAKESTRGSSGNLVDAARQWVEKQGLLPSRSSEELPLTESFPGSGGLVAAVKEARYDKEAVMKFFHMLIRRRYFSDETPAPRAWSISSVQRPTQRIDDDDVIDEDPQSYNTSQSGESYKYNMLQTFSAQRNVTPPPTFYPQQHLSVSENYSFPRFSVSSSTESNGTTR